MTTMLAARSRYFEDNGFAADGGYGDKWVDFKLGPFPFRIRNSAGRVRAVRYHDLHHVATGYTTDLGGELEISAWELGAGCRDFVAAWILNLGGLAAGILRVPVRTFRAFVRGRRTRSLYGRAFEPLLEREVDDVRREMGLVPEPSARATLADAALFALTGVAGLVVGAVLLVVGLVLGPIGVAAQRLTSAREASARAAAPEAPRAPSR